MEFLGRWAAAAGAQATRAIATLNVHNGCEAIFVSTVLITVPPATPPAQLQLSAENVSRHRESIRREVTAAGWADSVAQALVRAAVEANAAATKQRMRDGGYRLDALRTSWLHQIRTAAGRTSRVAAVEALLWLSWASWRGPRSLPTVSRRGATAFNEEADKQGDLLPTPGCDLALGDLLLTPLDPYEDACSPLPAALTASLPEHVLGSYLPRKLANFCGWSSAVTVDRIQIQHRQGLATAPCLTFTPGMDTGGQRYRAGAGEARR